MQGICFTEPLFHKVIGGTKTQTRRVIKPQTADNTLTAPRFKVGERLYLKEPYYLGIFNETFYLYGNEDKDPLSDSPTRTKFDGWENKLFMPAEYARYFIEITDVKYERMQDISNEDCLKEGIISYGGGAWYSVEDVGYIYKTPQAAYAELIDSIHGKGTWASNPFVWVYEFKIVK